MTQHTVNAIAVDPVVSHAWR